MKRELPDATELPRRRYSGWACVWCGASLREGGRSAGVARGHMGAHRLDVEVYECMPGRGCNHPRPGTPPA
ncbi:hypothetical protein [Streptomyces galilaeus]|uniref:C2H2-type domain-containing protein n=1 Tax=Streptomyces galilaeus TaxID=33899 RepID=A0ABW9IWB5_STRGJ